MNNVVTESPAQETNTIVRDTEGRQVIDNMTAKEQVNMASISPITSTHDTWMLGIKDRITAIAQAKMSKGTTQAWNLNRSKFISSVLNDYRMHNSGEFGKGEKLPENTFDKIIAEIDAFITEKMKVVHHGNVLSAKSAYAYTDKKGFFLKHTVIGHDELHKKEQIVACTIRIERAKIALKQEQGKINNNLERENELKQIIFKFELTLVQLKAELEELNKLAVEASK